MFIKSVPFFLFSLCWPVYSFLPFLFFWINSSMFVPRLSIPRYWDRPHTVVCFLVWPFRRLTKFPCALFQVNNWRAAHFSSVNIEPSLVLQRFSATADVISVVRYVCPLTRRSRLRVSTGGPIILPRSRPVLRVLLILVTRSD